MHEHLVWLAWSPVASVSGCGSGAGGARCGQGRQQGRLPGPGIAGGVGDVACGVSHVQRATAGRPVTAAARGCRRPQPGSSSRQEAVGYAAVISPYLLLDLQPSMSLVREEFGGEGRGHFSLSLSLRLDAASQSSLPLPPSLPLGDAQSRGQRKQSRDMVAGSDGARAKNGKT